MTTNNYRLDFQEAVVEVVSAYIESAEAIIDGKKYRMSLRKGKIVFQFEAKSKPGFKDWFFILPFTELYLAKWTAISRIPERRDPLENHLDRTLVSTRRGSQAARSHFERKGQGKRRKSRRRN